MQQFNAHTHYMCLNEAIAQMLLESDVWTKANAHAVKAQAYVEGT